MSGNPQFVPPEIGAMVRRIRIDNGMALNELARQSGVSASVLSQIERNQTNPTVSTIWRIATALGVGLESIINAGVEEQATAVLEPDSVPRLTSADGKCRWRILGLPALAGSVEWYDFVHDPDGQIDSKPHPRGTVEHMSLSSGALEVEIDGEKHVVRAGETLRYRGDFRHIIRNPFNETATGFVVVVVQSPS